MSKAFLVPLVLLVLSACGSSLPSTPALTPDHAYGAAVPALAEILTPEEFQRRLDAGELTLTRADDAATRRSFTQQQQARDLATLAAVPNQSEVLRALLTGTTDGQPTQDGDLLIQPIGTDGKVHPHLTLGAATVAHGLLAADQTSRDPINALEVYRAAYRLLTPHGQAPLPTPDSLSGKSITELQAAISSLDAAQGKVLDLDLVRPEIPGATAVKALTPLTVKINEGQMPAAGNGADNTGVCAPPSPDGLLHRLNWPLKTFVSPIKDQGQRGTCWAFSSVGALESRALVTDGASLDLSEQHYNNLRKFSTQDSYEGDWPRLALNDLAGRSSKLAPERAWTYNPSLGRFFSFLQLGVCTSYTGLCSETVHQSPLSCTVTGGVTFCGLEPVVYGGSAAPVATSNMLWDNLHGQSALPLNLIRTLLYNGQELILAFDVTREFVNLGPTGYLTLDSGGHFGGHAVQVIGFIPDSLTPFAPAVAGGTGGGWLVIKNSWGCSWGDAGYGYLPVSYVERNGWEIDTLSMPATRSAAFTGVRDALSASNPPLPLVTGVSVTGGPLELYPGDNADFRAEVSGTGAIDPNVDWTLSSAVGTLSSRRGTSVRYTAPATVIDQRLTLTATSVSNPGQHASTTLILHSARPAVRGTVEFSYVSSDEGAFTNINSFVTIPVRNRVTVVVALQAGTSNIDQLRLIRSGTVIQFMPLTPPLAARQSRSVTLLADMSDVLPGEYTLSVIGFDQAGNDVARADVTVKVIPPKLPVIGTPSPASLNLSALTGAVDSGTVTYANNGSAPLTAVAVPGAKWLSVLSNTLTPLLVGDTAIVSLQAVCPATAQVLTTTLTITAKDLRVAPQTVNVTLNCLVPPPIIGDPSPSVLNFSTVLGATVSGSFTFSNTGTAPLRAYVNPGMNSGWLNIASNVSRPLSVGETATVTLEATCPATPQTLTTVLTITANDKRVPDKQVAVNLSCVAPNPKPTSLAVGVTALSNQNVRPFLSATNPTVVFGKVAFSGYILADANPVGTVKLMFNGRVLSQNTVSVPAGGSQNPIKLFDLDTTTLTDGLYTVTVQVVDSGGAFSETNPFVIRVRNGGNPGPTSELYSINGVVVAPGQAPVILKKSDYAYDVNLYGGKTGYSGPLYMCLERAGQRSSIGQLPFGPQLGSNYYPVPIDGVTPLQSSSNSDQIAITDTRNGNSDALFLSGNTACDVGPNSGLPTTSVIRVIFTN